MPEGRALNTDPNDADSDNDGLSDGVEFCLLPETDPWGPGQRLGGGGA